MRHYLRSLFSGSASAEPGTQAVECVRSRRRELAKAPDGELRAEFAMVRDLPEVVALTAEVAKRVVGLDMFDVQIRGALAMANGKIAELQTGEGKTLVSVPKSVWLASARRGTRVMTVNDYLARRNAKWMSGIYELLGLSVGCIQQGMGIAERNCAYACDVTYATAN